MQPRGSLSLRAGLSILMALLMTLIYSNYVCLKGGIACARRSCDAHMMQVC